MIALGPRTLRWKVLQAMEDRSHWSIEQLVTATGLNAALVVRAIDALQDDELVQPVAWARTETLFELTPAGHRRLADGPQLQLAESRRAVPDGYVQVDYINGVPMQSVWAPAGLSCEEDKPW